MDETEVKTENGQTAVQTVPAEAPAAAVQEAPKPSGAKALVFAILATALVFDKPCMPLAFIFSIVSLVCARKGKGTKDKMFKVSKVLAIISLVVSIIMTVAFILAAIGIVTSIIAFLQTDFTTTIANSVAEIINSIAQSIAEAVSSSLATEIGAAAITA